MRVTEMEPIWWIGLSIKLGWLSQTWAILGRRAVFLGRGEGGRDKDFIDDHAVLGDNKIAMQSIDIMDRSLACPQLSIYHFLQQYNCMATPNKRPSQKEPNSLDLYNHLSALDTPNSLTNKTNQQAIFEAKRGKKKQMSNLIKSIQLIEQHSKNKEDIIAKQTKQQTHKRVRLDLMRLKDKSFQLQKNIYNIAIGEVALRQAYISSLHQQIAELKQKISLLQDEQLARMAHKTIADSFKVMVGSQQLQKEQKRPICGRIYSKESSPIFNRGTTPNPKVQRISTASNPRRVIQEKQIQHNSGKHLEREVIALQLSKQLINSHPTQRQILKHSIDQQQKLKPLSQYRIKQKANKQTINSFHQHEEDAIQKEQHSSISNRQLQFQSRQEARKQQQRQFPVQKQDNLQQKIKQQNEQLKQIFFDNPLWEITSIHDDFLNKITLKLQIPAQFPLPLPDPTDLLHSFQLKAHELYKVFNIDLKKCKQKVFVRKFKNGVFYQLKPNKNIVWYFDGSLYLGGWDTQSPNDLEKNGFGFEYVHNKFYYLGRFRDGVRSGRGAIKIINRNKGEFVGYDGQWFKGKPHGFGKQIDQHGNKYIGTFEYGEKCGKTVIMLGKDGLYYEGGIKNGLKEGKGVQKLPNGDVYTGNFSQGKFNGEGIYRWNNGSIFEGIFAKGKRQGKGVWKSYNGDQFEGEYLNDLKHGWGKFTWKNGQIYEGQFRNDLRHGEGYYKHQKGKMAKYLWKEGHIDHRLEDKNEQETNHQ